MTRPTKHPPPQILRMRRRLNPLSLPRRAATSAWSCTVTMPHADVRVLGMPGSGLAADGAAPDTRYAPALPRWQGSRSHRRPTTDTSSDPKIPESARTMRGPDPDR